MCCDTSEGVADATSASHDHGGRCTSTELATGLEELEESSAENPVAAASAVEVQLAEDKSDGVESEAASLPGRRKSKRRSTKVLRRSKDSGKGPGSPSPPAKSPRSSSAAILAQQRVQAFLAATRRAKREERRREACQSRFVSVDLEAFRRATEERVKLFRASSKDGDSMPASASGVLQLPPLTGSSSRVAESSPPSDDEVESIPAALPSQGGRQRRRRIAIVGGGPVGLWAATLIALRHARRLRGSGESSTAAGAGRAAVGFRRGADMPEITIFERREPQEHCTRRNVRITLDAHTVALLNKHTKSKRFLSGMALADIEKILLEQWQRLGRPGSLVCGSHVPGPCELAQQEDWDLILWAGGRWSLDNERRQALGCNMRTGEAEDVIVFEMRDFTPNRKGLSVQLADLEQLAAADLTGCARQAASAAFPLNDQDPNAGLRIVLRYAWDADMPTKPVAWLWLMGLPTEVHEAKTLQGKSSKPSSQRHGSMLEALNTELSRLGEPQTSNPEVSGEASSPSQQTSAPPWAIRLRAAVAALQEKMMSPTAVVLRWVDAAYWSADTVLCAVPASRRRSTPVLLIGDAAMGKPFYTGTTLNVHLSEVKALTQLPVFRWGDTSVQAQGDGSPERALRFQIANHRAALAPYFAYEEHYRELLKRTTGFRRRS